MGIEVFLLRVPRVPGAHKIGAAISGPRLAGGKIADMRLAPFLAVASLSEIFPRQITTMASPKPEFPRPGLCVKILL